MKYLVIYWIWIDYTILITICVISQKQLDKFFIQMNINVLKFYFQLKNDKNYVGGLCIKIHFILLSKC
jgi:hypothetical protein